VVEDAVGDWPPRWELTAPESHVISYRGEGFMGEPVRLALTELIVRGALALDEVERSGRRRREHAWALTDGPAAPSAVEPPLAVVLELVRAERQPLPVLRRGSTMAVTVEGVLVKDLKRAIRKRWRNVDGYRVQHVAPALVERGMLEEVRPARRGRRAEFDWTDAGHEADAQLSRWLELGRDHLADWVRNDRARAHAFTREAGSAVLLMRDQFSELEDLSRREGPIVSDLGGGESLPASGAAQHHQPALGHGGLGHGGAGPDLGGLGGGLGLDFGGLLDLGGGLGDFGGGGGDGGGGGGGNGGG